MPSKPRKPKKLTLTIVRNEAEAEPTAPPRPRKHKQEAAPETTPMASEETTAEAAVPAKPAKGKRRSKTSEPEAATMKAPKVSEPAKQEEHASSSFKADQADVRNIPLERIDLDDESYRFRASLRVGPLKQQLAEQGLQIPVVVRRIDGTHRYQLISGFRRATAATQLGWMSIPAIVRRDLDSDEAAFRASVAENTSRKTYSDIDRALVVRSYRERGHGQEEVGRMLGLTERQVRNVEKLLELPEVAQEAVDDPEVSFTATHALTLRQLAAKYAELDWAMWVNRVAEEDLSVSRLKSAVNKAHGRRKSGGRFGGLFREGETDAKAGVFRLQPAKIDVGKLTEEEKARLREELEVVLRALVTT